MRSLKEGWQTRLNNTTNNVVKANMAENIHTENIVFYSRVGVLTSKQIIELN